ncbi:MAG TPA: tetratricopeptide repeat protein [Sphingomonadales bacterium]|nr:tetratricopeptide repeat protein [Sphingomonadales bacterium]
MKSLFEELKRRNVFKVGVAYLVTSFVIIQVADILLPTFGAPDWVLKVLYTLIGFGFFLAVAMAWIYDVTPKGLQKTSAKGAKVKSVPGRGSRINKVIAVGLALSVGFIVYDKVIAPQGPVFTTATAGQSSIAVLPFVNLSSDPEQEYFSDGISEEILNVLAQIPELRVAARTSSFQFKGENRDVTEIGQKLNVGFVLEGSVRKAEGQVRITAQLIDASNGFHIWSETYDRDLKNIFALQDEISKAIVGELKTRMGLDAAGAVQAARATDPAAYDAYLFGIYQLDKRTPEALAAARASFERALSLDPDYVPALARLADTYILLGNYDFENYPPVEMRKKALPLIERALKLNPNSAEANATMGLYLRDRGETLKAEPYLRRALELNPSYATVRVWLASNLEELEKYDEGLEMLEQAARDDPLAPLAVGNLAYAYIMRGQFDDAAPLLEKLRTLSPTFYYRRHADIQEAQGRPEQVALAMLELMKTKDDGGAGRFNFSIYLSNNFGLYQEDLRFGGFPLEGYFATGQPDKAAALIKAFEPLFSPEDYGTQATFASVLLAAGDSEEARRRLEDVWQRLPERPGKIGLLGGRGLLALMETRRQAGDAAGVQEIVKLVVVSHDRLEAAQIKNPNYTWLKGWALLYDGREGEAMRHFRRAVEQGAMPGSLDNYLMSKFPNVDFRTLTALVEDKRTKGRNALLAIICNGGNPAPEIWTPLPETCEGHVKGSHEKPSR